MPISDRMKAVWNTFRNRPQYEDTRPLGPSNTYRPDRTRMMLYNERTIVTSIYNRLSMDFADVEYRHIKTDDQGRFSELVRSNLNYALTLEPNIDQGPRSFRQDLAMTMFDKGCAVIVPVDTSEDPEKADSLEIYTLRVGAPVQWYKDKIKVSVYNEDRQERQEIIVDKRTVAIVENPLYAIMNEPNSTLQRLNHKLALLDTTDDRNSSGKLDIIIQLPYTIKSEARRQQAEQRRNDIEFQLKGSQYGIAYTDATEKIVQLNRPAENNLLKQVEYLTATLHTQLGLTPEIINGTATEEAMLNYYARTIEPLVLAVVEAMQRSFIGRTKTAKGERIDYYRDPFKLVPLSQLAELADSFTRNEILSSNEFRGILGFRPSDDPKADELRNSNMPQEGGSGGVPPEAVTQLLDEMMDGIANDVDRIVGGQGEQN